MAGFLVVMFAGFAGSFHCIGMCGGFACALGPVHDQTRVGTVIRHLLYNSGRLVTYAFIGALAGLFGALLVGHGSGHRIGLAHEVALLGISNHDMGFTLTGELGFGQRLLAIVGGSLMIFMALRLFGLLPHRPSSWMALGSEAVVSALRSILASRSPAAPVALGVLNGFLPCPLVFAFAALAAAAGTVQAGVLTMAAFGLGTFPAMLFMGALGWMLGPVARRHGVWLAASFILLLGLLTLVRGLAPSILHLGSHGA